MVRRSLGVALWSVAGALACFLGALAALVSTGAGRDLLRASARAVLDRAVAGAIEVGDVGGTLLTGLTLSDVLVFDARTSLVAALPHVEVSYNPFELAAGRVVLLEVHLDRPFINLVQYPNGRLNLEELLRLGGSDSGPRGPGGPAPLVVLRNVRIEDGTLVLRLQDRPSPGDSTLEIDAFGSDGRRRIRRFEHLDARLATLRLSSPREPGIFADIRALAVVSSDPAFTLTGARGRLTVLGDSLEADFAELRLPGSGLAARGRVSWPRDTLLYRLDLGVDSAALEDFHWIDERFPAGATLRGELGLRSRGGRFLEVTLDPVAVAYHGGTLSGRVTAVSEAGEGLVALRDARLVTTDFDLEFARPFLDTLPFAGRLTGKTDADGRLSALALAIDWLFRDSLVSGWPETAVQGRGEVDLTDGDGLAFRPFAVEQGSVALGTVGRLVPGFRLRGTLDAVGTMTGPYKNALFSGSLRHRDGARAPSVVRGVLQLDSRRDTLGVYADLVADSLAFEGLRGSFPALPLAGTASGLVRLAGTLAALETHAELTMREGGTVQGDGVLVLLPPHWGARDFTLRAADFDLRRWFADGPSSRLALSAVGSVGVDSAAPPVGRLRVSLAPSLFAGAVLDSGAALVRFADARVYVDSLRLAQSGLVTTGQGALGWDRSASGAVTLELDADSLSALDSLVTWLAGAPANGAPGANGSLRGAAQARLTLRGSLDSIALEADGSGRDMVWRGWGVPAWSARLGYRPGPVPEFDFAAELDSVARDRFGFGAASVAARGTRDSLAWFARSRVGELGAFLAGGRAIRRRPGTGGHDLTVAVDSLALLLPGGVWLLEDPTALALDDSVVGLDTLAMRRLAGPGRLRLAGVLPVRGPGSAALHLEAFPLAAIYALLQRDTLGVGGTLTATFGLTGARADPAFRGSFALAEGSFGRFRAPFVDGTFDYGARRLEGALNLWRAGQQILNVSWHLPLDLSLTDVAERQLADTLSVRARADSVDLSVLEALTPLVSQVRGAFSADVGIAGTWERPRLEGGLRIADAAAFIPALNVRYEDVNGRFTLVGDSIRVDSLSAQGEEARGRAEVSGVVRLERLTRPVLALDIRATDFRALDLRGNVSVTASGRLSLAGPVIGATLSGRGTVTSGVLYFADLVQKRVVNLDAPWVTSLIDTSLALTIRRQRLGSEFKSRFLDSLKIRGLELAMGSDAWLRSTEANIQLSGVVEVTKTADTYVLTGTLQAPRGTYRLALGPVTREFLVSQGTVRYFGTPDLDAALDIEAKHTVHTVPQTGGVSEDLTIVARIRGTLLVPQLTLEAEGRELSQTEVISYLLFGQPSVELAGEQGTFGSRASMLRQAIGNIVGTGLSGEAERFLVSDLGVPLDYVELRPQDPANPLSGARFAAGWQIGRKTFLVLNAGFCGERPVEVGKALGASFQFRISPEWRTEASFEPVLACGSPVLSQSSLSESRQIGLDLFWEKRY